MKFLDGNAFIESYEIQDYRHWENGFYYKLTVIFTDDSVLFVREYVDENERNYSFHWQTTDNQLIMRWDNAPHHRHIPTYPHHKHTSDGIFESVEISLEDVLKFIASMM